MAMKEQLKKHVLYVPSFLRSFRCFPSSVSLAVFLASSCHASKLN